jgi:hypothetical protein
MRKLCGGSGTGHGHVTEVELLKLKKRGQFPDELENVFYYEGIKRDLNRKHINQ